MFYLDDDPSKQRQQIHGVPVLGDLADLPRVVAIRRINEVIIAIPSAPGRVIRQVAETCRTRNIPFRTMPGIYELIGGKVNVNRLREVEITDLLRREPAHIDDSLIGAKPERAAGAGDRRWWLDRARAVPPDRPLDAGFPDPARTRREQHF